MSNWKFACLKGKYIDQCMGGCTCPIHIEADSMFLFLRNDIFLLKRYEITLIRNCSHRLVGNLSNLYLIKMCFDSNKCCVILFRYFFWFTRAKCGLREFCLIGNLHVSFVAFVSTPVLAIIIRWIKGGWISFVICGMNNFHAASFSRKIRAAATKSHLCCCPLLIEMDVKCFRPKISLFYFMKMKVLFDLRIRAASVIHFYLIKS